MRTTKTPRATKVEVLRCLARLTAQARVNVGDCQDHRRTREAQAWLATIGCLRYLAALINSVGVVEQPELPLGDESPRS